VNLDASPVRAHRSEAGTGAVQFRRSARARRYRLTLRRDGTAVATVPARGSIREAERFVERHAGWLERARARLARRPTVERIWVPGTSVLWRGSLTEIRAGLPSESGYQSVCLASDVFRLPSLEGDLRPVLEKRFAHRARIELPARAWELAALTGVPLKNVSVRNQRSRWGSCSVSGTVTLNWRLVQAPEEVRDYIILHELMHFHEMNHSNRFWARVEQVCPGWRDAEAWLKCNDRLLGR
jgi:predicted metal-dependent hydrolase